MVVLVLEEESIEEETLKSIWKEQVNLYGEGDIWA